MTRLLDGFRSLWSTTRFAAEDLTTYAEDLMVDETRRGLMTMSFVSLLLLVSTSILYSLLGLKASYAYTNALLAALSLHIFISSRFIRDLRVLHLLGMTLLTISGVAFVLLAHRTGTFTTLLLTSVVLLFMVVPMVPWGLKQATAVVLMIYGVFTFSTLAGPTTFGRPVLLTLQFVMLGAATATLTLVGRGAAVRRDDIRARFDLLNAHKAMEVLSFQDPLTGAWNRRYLQRHFAELLRVHGADGGLIWFVLFDVDEFKGLNDNCGHDYGDKVLQWLSAAFRSVLGDNGVVARMGGDEFALLFTSDDPEEVLREAMALVTAQNERSRRTEDTTIAISAGIVPVIPARGPSLEGVYRDADRGLYEAKAKKGADPTSVNIVRGRRPAEMTESSSCASPA